VASFRSTLAEIRDADPVPHRSRHLLAARRRGGAHRAETFEELSARERIPPV
jgi:hypothetical protein